MSDKLFFDTNVLIYAATDDAERARAARAWLWRGGSFSVQVLAEFGNTARRKLDRSWDDIVAALDALRTICRECLALTEQTHHVGVDLSRRNICRTGNASKIG